MKLYLFDTINRYKRYSETLDVKTKICNRPWIVFNDGGEKEVYKFKEDGTINIVLSGRVTRGTWEYDPSDKTIIISASNQSYMVHPGMYDDMLLALQVDGTNECSFLIEENNSKNFAPQTYSELMLFFEEMERKRIEEEERRRKEEERRRKEEERRRKEEERRRKEEEERRKEEEERRKREEAERRLEEEKKSEYTPVTFLDIIKIFVALVVSFALTSIPVFLVEEHFPNNKILHYICYIVFGIIWFFSMPYLLKKFNYKHL